MRILFDIRPLMKGSATGIPVYVRAILENLIARDRENEYILFANAFRAPVPFFVRNRPCTAQIVNWRIPNRLLDLSFHFLGTPKVDRLARADVVFNPHFNAFAAHRDTRRVVTFHDLSFLRYPEFFSPRERAWHWRQDPKRQAREASHLIAVSEAVKRDLMEYYNVTAEKISVTHLGVNPYFSTPVSAEALDAFRRARHLEDPFLLFVGTLEPRKNVEGVVRAFNLLKARKPFAPLRLVIAGGEGWLYGGVLKEIARSPWTRDIVRWGFATNEELRHLYRAASVFVFPSFYEGFGFPPLEAQASGTPVVASSRGALAEVLGDSALFADPLNPESVAAQVENLFGNRGLREYIVTKGLANIKRFRWETTAAATLSVLTRGEV